MSIEQMPSITDWLMVIITFVYVVATIIICRVNMKSVSASKEALAEMKRQYAEENRPRIEVEFCYKYRAWYIIRFINHGDELFYLHCIMGKIRV